MQSQLCSGLHTSLNPKSVDPPWRDDPTGNPLWRDDPTGDPTGDAPAQPKVCVRGGRSIRNIDSDGTLTFHSAGYPDIELTKSLCPQWPRHLKYQFRWHFDVPREPMALSDHIASARCCSHLQSQLCSGLHTSLHLLVLSPSFAALPQHGVVHTCSPSFAVVFIRR